MTGARGACTGGGGGTGSEGGVTVSDIDGNWPPELKNVSRICAARWNSRNVLVDWAIERPSGVSCRHDQSAFDVSIYCATWVRTKLSRTPCGPKNWPKSASATSRSLLAKG